MVRAARVSITPRRVRLGNESDLHSFSFRDFSSMLYARKSNGFQPIRLLGISSTIFSVKKSRQWTGHLTCAIRALADV